MSYWFKNRKINNENLIITPYEESRPWGSWKRYTANQLSTVKIIKVKPNEWLSLQTHEFRDEYWVVIKGDGWAEIGLQTKEASVGDEFFIPREVQHRLSAGENGIEILEIALGNYDESDGRRIRDKYARS